jgi:plasmid stabilization system protein ParE
MARVRIQEAASWRLDEIYRYTQDRWGEEQAERYITGLFEAFERIDSHGVVSRPVPAEFGVEGFFFRCQRHFVYWKRLSNGDVGIVTILHERMHQIARFRQDFFGEGPPPLNP